MFSRYVKNISKGFKGMALITGLVLLLGFLVAANFADRDNPLPWQNLLSSQAGGFATQVAINLSQSASNKVLGGLDIILDYDETKLIFRKVSAGNPGTGAIVVANDGGKVVRAGLIHPDGFNIPYHNPVLIFSFDVVQGGASQAGDFKIIDFMAADLLKGADVDLDVSDVTFKINSRVAGVGVDHNGSDKDIALKKLAKDKLTILQLNHKLAALAKQIPE